MKRLELVALLSSLLLACGPTSGTCQKNGDCTGFEVCLNGACVAQSNLGGTGGGAGATGGGSAAGGGTAAGGGGGSTSGGGSCCLNGAFYACGTKQAFDACAGFDVGACHDACALSDFTCHMTCDTNAANATHDPSQCTRTAARDGECGTTSTGDVCSDSRGAACTYSTQCNTNNCTDGYCRGNDVGARCTYSTQCSSNNCTDGCCRGNGKGSKCTYSTQCTSNNCTGGRCQ